MTSEGLRPPRPPAAVPAGDRPLAGRRIVVTRAAGGSETLRARLSALGAEVVELPLVSIEPPEDAAALRRAAGQLDRFDGVVFASRNAVETFLDAMADLDQPPAALDGKLVAAVGPATASALGARGVVVSVVSEEHRGEALARTLATRGISGLRLLLPRARDARTELEEALRSAGAEVTPVVAYRTLAVPGRGRALLDGLRAGRVAAVTFASGSAVSAFCDALLDVGADPSAEASRTLIACLGPVTADAARARGLPVHVVARTATAEDLSAALVARLRGSAAG